MSLSGKECKKEVISSRDRTLPFYGSHTFTTKLPSINEPSFPCTCRPFPSVSEGSEEKENEPRSTLIFVFWLDSCRQQQLHTKPFIDLVSLFFFSFFLSLCSIYSRFEKRMGQLQGFFYLLICFSIFLIIFEHTNLLNFFLVFPNRNSIHTKVHKSKIFLYLYLLEHSLLDFVICYTSHFPSFCSNRKTDITLYPIDKSIYLLLAYIVCMEFIHINLIPKLEE